jgi:hypothetical protein
LLGLGTGTEKGLRFCSCDSGSSVTTIFPFSAQARYVLKLAVYPIIHFFSFRGDSLLPAEISGRCIQPFSANPRNRDRSFSILVVGLKVSSGDRPLSILWGVLFLVKIAWATASGQRFLAIFYVKY